MKKVMLFTYDFPHKKTQDFIERLVKEEYKIEYVISAPWVKLSIPKSVIDIDPVYSHLTHPKKLSKRFDIRYYVYSHNSAETIQVIKKNPVDVYIISGARILSPELIHACRERILNLHPGLLPEVRGLDTILWSIYYDMPIGISAHFISPKIDSGSLIHKEPLIINLGDSLKSISRKLLNSQSDVLIKTLKILEDPCIVCRDLNMMKNPYRSRMPKSLVQVTLKKFPSWRYRYSA